MAPGQDCDFVRCCLNTNIDLIRDFIEIYDSELLNIYIYIYI